MIKSEAQRKRTLAQIEGFRSALDAARRETSGKRQAVLVKSYQSMMDQLAAEVAEFDQLKAGRIRVPPIDRLDQIAPVVTRIRIAKGISQTELARRLGVSKQLIHRYEESDYQTLGLAKLQQVLDAMGVVLRAKVSA